MLPGNGLTAFREPRSLMGDLSADVRLLTVHRSLMITRTFGRPHRFDMHCDQSIASIFVRVNAKCNVPRRCRQFIWCAIKIDRATMSSALTQAKDEMLVFHDAWRSNRLNFAGQ